MAEIALYARVSTEQQARYHTIASQIAALRERIAADGGQLEPDHAYIDEGCSGSSLLRPALERLRDAAAAGRIDRLYVHAPDRLARRYAQLVARGKPPKLALTALMRSMLVTLNAMLRAKAPWKDPRQG